MNISEWLESHHQLLSVIAAFGALLISLVNILQDGFVWTDLNPILVALGIFAATFGAKKQIKTLSKQRDEAQLKVHQYELTHRGEK
jgi:hypothetical protein